jgi:asparagine synthase (glutamine-hydrolysing)
MDQPSIDGINSWFVSKAAKELGIKVAISGLGGDELFGGYPAFTDIPRWVKHFRIPSRIPFLGNMVIKAGARFLTFNASLSPKALGLVKYGGTYAGAWLLRRGIYMPWELKKLLTPEFVGLGLERLKPIQHIETAMSPDTSKAFSNIASMESSLYMRNQLLRDADWAGMAHSLEIRVPLVDATLLKRLAPLLTAQAEIEGKKWLGRSPADRLPEQIINRDKTGFTTPIRDWLGDSLKSGSDRNHHW